VNCKRKNLSQFIDDDRRELAGAALSALCRISSDRVESSASWIFANLFDLLAFECLDICEKQQKTSKEF
jgi:hypothetical protein